MIEPVMKIAYFLKRKLERDIRIFYSIQGEIMDCSRRKTEEAKQRLAGLGEVKSRTQFGGYCLSVEKTVFAVVAEGNYICAPVSRCSPT